VSAPKLLPTCYPIIVSYSFAFLVTATFCCVLQLCSLVTNTSCSSGYYPLQNTGSGTDVPPPLPSRKSLSMQCLSPPPLPPRPLPAINTQNTAQLELNRHLTHLTPSTVSHGIPNSVSSLIAQYHYINSPFYIYFMLDDKCMYVHNISIYIKYIPNICTYMRYIFYAVIHNNLRFSFPKMPI